MRPQQKSWERVESIQPSPSPLRKQTIAHLKASLNLALDPTRKQLTLRMICDELKEINDELTHLVA